MYTNRDDTELDHVFPFRAEVVTLYARDQDGDAFHWHNYYEITLILDGAGCCYVNGQVCEVAKGDIVLINSAELHGWQVFEREMQALTMAFSTELIAPFGGFRDMDSLMPRIDRDARFKNHIRRLEPCTAAIAGTMREIQAEWTERRSGYPMMIRADVLRILTLLSRHCRDDARGEEDIHRNKALMRLQPAFEYIDSNYCGKVTLKEAADRVYMSPNYFSRFFHVSSGISFSDYVTMRRLRKAWRLMETTGKSIYEIAIECGFPNSSNFYRLYKKYIGKSPRGSR